MSNPARAFSATLVDEWVRCGVRHAFVAPGSRSTPLALALVEREELATEVVLDERDAAFMALGTALASGRPAVVLTTSGTAVTHLHAAVAEADLAEVPLLVCTADRPPELYGVGAAQTIDQRRVFGAAVRSYLDLGVPDEANRPAWRSLAARAVADATAVPPGPVQLNLPFREPLAGEPGPLPAGRAGGRAWHRRVVAEPAPPTGLVAESAAAWSTRRGVILAGAGVEDPAAVLALGETLGWPVLAEPRSGCRVDHQAAVAHADAVLRVPSWATALRPEVIVQFGAPAASKVLAAWVAATTAGDGADLVVVNRAGSWWDADRRAALVVGCGPGVFADAVRRAVTGGSAGVPASGGSVWLRTWRLADDVAAGSIAATLDEAPDHEVPAEPAVARAVLGAACRSGASALVVSSSMPVRDLEWYAPRLPAGTSTRVLANRGANGIDGVVATAAGAAIAGEGAPVWVLLGDLAFLHDANALLNLTRRPLRLRIVVVDNRGGGIFSFLPQAGQVAATTFEQLFGTTQHVDVAAVLEAHGVPTFEAARNDELAAALARLEEAGEAVAAVVVRVADRQANVAAHTRLHDEVATRLGPAPALGRVD